MNKKSVVDGLFEKRSQYANDDQAEMAADLLEVTATDIYTESHRFVFELIQNADDSAKESKRKEVHFAFLDDALVVSHFGKPFDQQDIESLTTAGRSTKRDDPDKTGYKGIGFKSVFGQSKRVTIFSDGYQFRFDKEYFKKRLPWQVIPVWTEVSDLSPSVQDYISKNNFPVSTVIEVGNPEALLADLKEIIGEGKVLLFLRWISTISVSKGGCPVAIVERRVLKESVAFDEVSLYRDGKQSSSWIVKRFDNIAVPEDVRKKLISEDKTPDKLKKVSVTELSFAAKIERGKISSLSGRDSIIFTYLPTKVSEFEFPFLVNGSFLTNAGRETMHDDRIWNQWVFGQVAGYMFKWLELISQSAYRFQVLHILGLRYESATSALKRAFNTSFDIHLPLASFIVVDGDKLGRANEVIFDETGLSKQKFVGRNAVVEYANATLGGSFKDDCFVHSLLERVDVLAKLGVVVLQRDNLEKFLRSDQLKKYHKIEENIELIRYLKALADGDSEGVWFHDLKYLPFIFDQKGVLYNPIDGVCFPTDFSDEETPDIPTIHTTVYATLEKDSKLLDWLKRLGVKTPSRITYVTNVIVPGIRAGNYITDQNFLKVTRYLFQLFSEQQLEMEVLECLRELPLKVMDSGAFVPAQECYLANFYEPALRIEGVILELSYVSDIYVKDGGGTAYSWSQFFRAIKVKDRIAIEVINGNNEMPTISKVASSVWIDDCQKEVSRVKGGFGFHPRNLMRNVKIPSFLKLTETNYKFGVIFWEQLLDSEVPSELFEKAVFVYGKGLGNNSYRHDVDNFFPWFVASRPCIPTSMNTILKSDEVYLNKKEIVTMAGSDLPVFSYKGKLSDEWKAVFKFRSLLSVDDCLHIFTCIANAFSGNRPDNKPPEKRIGMIYEHLANRVEDMTGEEKQKIKVWAETGKLLADSGEFIVASTMKWINAEGFSGGQGLEVILMPSNCRVTPTVEDLLKLFGVQFVKEFFPQFEEKVLDFSLKKRLELVLPYFAAIIEKRDYISEEFERLYAIVNRTDFYSVKNILLSFEYLGEVVSGPSLKVYKDATGFYFVGKFSSALTLFKLVPELANLFQVTQLKDQLQLLLTADEDELKEWMTSEGYNLSTLHAVKPFVYQTRLIEEVPASTNGRHLASGRQDGASVEQTEVVGDLAIVEELEVIDTFDSSPFVAELEPSQAVASGVHVSRKSYTTAVTPAVAGAAFSEMSSGDDREEVGRWAEMMVYLQLSQSRDDIESVQWVNENGETGAPYDLIVKQNGVTRYIDVKGTPSASKNVVYLSEQEWKFMFERGEHYSICRVYNAGRATASMEFVDNPSHLIATGQILPNPITLAI